MSLSSEKSFSSISLSSFYALFSVLFLCGIPITRILELLDLLPYFFDFFFFFFFFLGRRREGGTLKQVLGPAQSPAQDLIFTTLRS